VIAASDFQLTNQQPRLLKQRLGRGLTRNRADPAPFAFMWQLSLLRVDHLPLVSTADSPGDPKPNLLTKDLRPELPCIEMDGSGTKEFRGEERHED